MIGEPTVRRLYSVVTRRQQSNGQDRAVEIDAIQGEEAAAPPGATESARRQYLVVGHTDAAAIVRATDTKCYVALVTQGLLFGGTTSIVRSLGGIWDDGSPLVRGLIVGELSALLLLFAASVAHLLLCVAPSPRSALPTLPRGDRQLLFPEERGSFESLAADVEALDGPGVDRQLLLDLWVLVDIRRRKTRLAANGYRFLLAQVGVTVAFMVTAGLASL